MPKVLKAYDSDYIIAVRENGEITLDVGSEGTVFVTGNLNIRGDSTAINTTDLEIEDNTIVLNKGEDGPGVSVGTAGIEIDRGFGVPNARWIFDEQITWTLGGLSGQGTFYAEEGSQKLPINTPGIVAQGNFYVDTGNGVISVTNTPDYEEKIFNYNNGVIEPSPSGTFVIDDDTIPNTKAVKDYIDYSFANTPQAFIGQGDTEILAIDEFHPLLDIISVNVDGNNTTVIQTQGPHGFTESDLLNIQGVLANGDPLENLNGTNIDIVEVINAFTIRLDRSVVGADVNQYVANSGTISKAGFQESRIKFTVEDTEIANFYNNRFNIDGIEIKNTEISTTESNSDLVLKSSGIGSVKIDDILEITAAPYDDDLLNIPVSPQQGIKLYSTNPGPGTTGLYYVNSNNRNDELVSKNRSLLFSMLF